MSLGLTMRKLGWRIFLVGLGWFLLAILGFFILTAMEQSSGRTPAVDNLTGAFLFFGMYFGSWLLMCIGPILIFLDSVLRLRRSKRP